MKHLRRMARWALAAALAGGFVSAGWGFSPPGGGSLNGRGSILWQVQSTAGDSARVAVAGQRLSVRAAPKGGARIVGHVEKGAEVIVVDQQSPWAKIEDYQSGQVLGWVYEALLISPGG